MHIVNPQILQNMINPIYSADKARYSGGMKYRRCGKSGILLPEVSLGLWHNFGDVDTLANSLRMAHFAFDKGITHFDLANNYGPSYGSAEETFGLIMKKSLCPIVMSYSYPPKPGMICGKVLTGTGAPENI